MNRREFIKILAVGAIGYGLPSKVLAVSSSSVNYDEFIRDYLFTSSSSGNSLKEMTESDWDYIFQMKNYDKPLLDDVMMHDVLNIKDYLKKMMDFDKPHAEDIVVRKADYGVFASTFKKIRTVQKVVGNGHFQVLSFDRALKTARTYSQVGRFTKEELKFMEEIFYKEASLYGFTGEKTMETITRTVDKKAILKVPYTGNYLYKGTPLEMYKEIKKQVGKNVMLTSGIRGVMKQFYLFLNKAYKNGGNLSLASRSLAPPGYSFHGNGDFDVGQVGFGVSNFTSSFTKTDVFKRLCDLGYLKLRYPEENYVGVRFEPWHIKTHKV